MGGRDWEGKEWNKISGWVGIIIIIMERQTGLGDEMGDA